MGEAQSRRRGAAATGLEDKERRHAAQDEDEPLPDARSDDGARGVKGCDPRGVDDACT